jgi:hypothetical protein
MSEHIYSKYNELDRALNYYKCDICGLIVYSANNVYYISSYSGGEYNYETVWAGAITCNEYLLKSVLM